MMADVQELRALINAATPSRPWEVYPLTRAGRGYGIGYVTTDGYKEGICEDSFMSVADAALIAGAVNALPELLDEVEQLRMAISAAERRAEEAEACESAALNCLQSSAHKLWRLPPADRTMTTDAVWRDMAYFKPSDAGRALLDRLHAIEGERDALRAEVERLKARTARVCVACYGHGLAHLDGGAPRCSACNGAGAVVAEGQK